MHLGRGESQAKSLIALDVLAREPTRLGAVLALRAHMAAGATTLHVAICAGRRRQSRSTPTPAGSAVLVLRPRYRGRHRGRLLGPSERSSAWRASRRWRSM